MHLYVIDDLVADFAKEHTRLYGYAAAADVELVTLRLTARAALDRPEFSFAGAAAERRAAHQGNAARPLPAARLRRLPRL